MCHVSYMRDEPRPFLDADLLDRLSCLRGATVQIGSGFEPTLHPEFSRIVRRLADFDCEIHLVTNGTLIDGDILSALADAKVSSVTVSFDGIRKQTFEHIRRGANYERALERILAFRSRFSNRDTAFSLNSVIMRRNLDEIIPSIDFWESQRFRQIGLIPMVVRADDPELIAESLYPVRAEFVRAVDEAARHVIEGQLRIGVSSASFATSKLKVEYPGCFSGTLAFSDAHQFVPAPHSVHRAARGAHPGMPFPCNSPFTAAKIDSRGNVLLCNAVRIGNLREADFETIWNSGEADGLRAKVLGDTAMCEACDYFRFCINSPAIDVESRESHFAGTFLNAANEAPHLVESVNGHNIVFFGGKYYGVPQSLGPIDLSKTDISEWPGVVVNDRFATVRHAVGRPIR